jgi:predicted metal-binding membrane protein
MLLERRRRGRAGALRMGLEHGGACIGCCWALMAALFALGVMSIAWMAFVAALIAAERLLPWKGPAVRAVAVVLAVLGLAVAFAPEKVPGLTIPGPTMSVPAMGMDAAPAPMR